MSHVDTETSLLRFFEEQGIRLKASWYITSGFTPCPQSLITPIHPTTIAGSREALMQLILNSDMKTVSDGLLPKDAQKIAKGLIERPTILQVERLSNVAAPLETQYQDSAHRVIKLELTDGAQNVVAIEHSFTPQLKLSMPAGTKLCIRNVRIESSALLLNKTNVTVLGGSRGS